MACMTLLKRRWPVVCILSLLVLTMSAVHLTPASVNDPLTAGTLDSYYSGTVHVNVTDNANRTVAGATVYLVGNVSWVTNSTGEVLITGLLADTNGTSYTLWAEKDGYIASPPKAVVVTPDNTSYVDLTIRGGTVVGAVTEDGGPVQGANVSIPELGMYTFSDSEGTYRLNGVKSGTYSIIANATNHNPLSKVVTVPAGETVQVNFALTSLTGTISGVVYHSTTLDPLNGANVSVRVGVLTITVASSIDGIYMLPGLSAGTYTVTATLDGFNTSTVEDVDVVSGQDTEGVDIYLDEKPTKIWGVVKAGTVLLVGANISVEGTDAYAISSIDGEYEIGGIPAGTYTITASLVGYYNQSVQNVVVAVGSEVQLNFNLTGYPGGLYGVVIDARTGEHLSGVRVTLLPQRETMTNINGEFEFTGLEAGDYSLLLYLEDYKPKEVGPITITEDETTDLGHIQLEPLRESYGGFIFGFDLAHSMMILALFLTIIILAFAVVLRIRSFESPEEAPAVYDEEDFDEEEEYEGEETESAKEVKGEGGEEV